MPYRHIVKRATLDRGSASASGSRLARALGAQPAAEPAVQPKDVRGRASVLDKKMRDWDSYVTWAAKVRGSWEVDK